MDDKLAHSMVRSSTPHVRAMLACVAATATVVFCLLGASRAAMSQTPKDPAGVTAITDLEHLPRLRSHTTAHQVSSHDPTGGNDDGFFTVNFKYFDRSRNEFVLLEETGPGCVYRIQMSDLRSFFGGPVRIRVYVDGAAMPQIDVPILQLFDGSTPGFKPPLVGSSHAGFGYYSYVPIPFRSSLRIALSGLVSFYNINFHKYRPGIGSTPTYGNDRSVNDAIAVWNGAGGRPTPVRPNERPLNTPIWIPGNTTANAATINTGGTIVELELTPPWNPNVAVNLSDVWLRIFWDGENTPSVEAPLSLFFAAGDTASAAEGLLIGSEPSGKLYCYFPMPFWRSARIDLENKQGHPITTELRLTYRTSGPPTYNQASTGYFKCRYQARNSTVPGSDYNAITVGGRGSIVGVVLDMAGSEFLNFEGYMEGDERAYVDFNASPAYHGNGTEDFFNGAYYFLNGTFDRPAHGAPFRQVTPTLNRRIAYRLMIGDQLPFAAHARLGFEVGGLSHLYGNYRSVVFYYHQPEPALEVADHLDIGNAAQEHAHDFTMDGRRVGPLTGKYVGDLDDEPIVDQGIALPVGRMSEFTAAIPAANDGVILRRRLDYENNGVAGQTVRVEVNGNVVGNWTIPGAYLNHLAAFPSAPASRSQGAPDKRWLDADFHIPATLTSGRTQLRIRLVNVGPGDWNAYDYRVYAYRTAPAGDTQAPATPTNLVAKGLATDSIELTWRPVSDDVGVAGYEVLRSPTSSGPLTTIARVFGTRYEDRHVDPANGPWFYRVRAVDAAGNAGGLSTAASGTPGRTLYYECEELLPATTSARDQAGQLDLVLFPQFGRVWSRDNQVLFVADRYGDWIEFAVPVTVAGRYELSLSYATFTGTTSFDVSIDGQRVGPTVHHPLAISRRTVVFPPTQLAAGTRRVRITLVSGPAVYNGTQAVLDAISLTPR